jgi:hypothetical protein
MSLYSRYNILRVAMLISMQYASKNIVCSRIEHVTGIFYYNSNAVHSRQTIDWLWTSITLK